MNLDQLRYIHEVAQCHSISQAAKRLYITQPTVSNAIHNLEEELGYQIFQRSNQGAILTENGTRLMESIRVILNEINLIQQVKQDSSYFVGDVYVDAVPSICSTIIPRVIISLKQKYPGINVHVHQSVSEKNISMLLAGMSNIMITSLAGTHQTDLLHKDPMTKNFQVEPLLKENYVLYVGSNNPLANVKETTLEEAYAYPWIIFQEHAHDDSCFYMGEDEICPNSIMAFQDKDSVKQAIAANLGVAVMAASFIAPEDPYITAGLIHRVSLEDVKLTILHVMLLSEKHRLTKAEQVFIEELRAVMRQYA